MHQETYYLIVNILSVKCNHNIMGDFLKFGHIYMNQFGETSNFDITKHKKWQRLGLNNLCQLGGYKTAIGHI